jgi:hypothetical protein
LAETIWKIWSDVDNWHQWHDDLDYCKLEGNFEPGSFFRLKPKGVKEVKVFLTAVVKGKSFTDCTYFPGARMYDDHEIEVLENGILISNTVTVKGALSWLWVKLVARDVANHVPNEMLAMTKLAKEIEKHEHPTL